MSKIKGFIEVYEDHQFSSGTTTGLDYKGFEVGFEKILKDISNNLEARLTNFSRGHYNFSTFMERDGNFAYISISDVRGSHSDWKDNILVRSAKHSKDYTGGANTFTTLAKLEDRIDNILK